jgi:hypothetical protein
MVPRHTAIWYGVADNAFESYRFSGWRGENHLI